VWFTQTTKGNIARITDAGVITEGKVVSNSEPFGITFTPNGDPWYMIILALTPIHPSASKEDSANFAVTEF
jgi:streptogramin lyase